MIETDRAQIMSAATDLCDNIEAAEKEMDRMTTELAEAKRRLEQMPKDVLRWVQTGGTTAELMEIVGGLDAALSPDFTCPGCADWKATYIKLEAEIMHANLQLEDRDKRLEAAKEAFDKFTAEKPVGGLACAVRRFVDSFDAARSDTFGNSDTSDPEKLEDSETSDAPDKEGEL